MSAWGLQLISAIMSAEDPQKAYEFVVDVKKIEPKHLINIEARGAFQAIKSWYERPQEFGHVPSTQRLEEFCPQLVLPTPQEPIMDLADAVKNEFLHQHLQTAHEELGLHLADKDPIAALDFLRLKVAEIDEQHIIDSDVDFGAAGPKIVSEYLKQIKLNDGLLGIPWPWEPLNDATQGIQNSDLIVFYGLPKSMKTWLGLFLTMHLVQLGYRVLIFSREMTAQTMSLRCASILAKIAYTRLRAGDLTLEEYNRLFYAMDALKNIIGTQKLIFTRASKADGGPGGVSDIHRKVLRYKPHLVLLDSAYMMSNDRAGSHSLKWNDLAAVSQDVKQMASTSGTPTIMIWQENESKAMKFKGTGARGTASLAMASQLIYYCDVAVRAILNESTEELSLHFSATREFKFKGFTIHAKPGYNFGFSKWDLYEIAEGGTQGGNGKGGSCGAPADTKSLGDVAGLTALFKNSMGPGGKL